MEFFNAISGRYYYTAYNDRAETPFEVELLRNPPKGGKPKIVVDPNYGKERYFDNGKKAFLPIKLEPRRKALREIIFARTKVIPTRFIYEVRADGRYDLVKVESA